jgi:hypothetical protein
MNNPNLGKIVKFTNITSKDFTHAFGGQPFFVKAGDTVMLPYDLGHHLAKHLARRIFLDGDTSSSIYDPTDKTGGSGKVLWDDDKEAQMVAKILGETIQQEVPVAKTDVELLNEKVAELNRQFSEVLGKKAEQASEPSSADVAPNPGGYKDKAEVIAELKALGVAVDARQTKAALEAKLTEMKNKPANASLDSVGGEII